MKLEKGVKGKRSGQLAPSCPGGWRGAHAQSSSWRPFSANILSQLSPGL